MTRVTRVQTEIIRKIRRLHSPSDLDNCPVMKHYSMWPHNSNNLCPMLSNEVDLVLTRIFRDSPKQLSTSLISSSIFQLFNFLRCRRRRYVYFLVYMSKNEIRCLFSNVLPFLKVAGFIRRRFSCIARFGMVTNNM